MRPLSQRKCLSKRFSTSFSRYHNSKVTNDASESYLGSLWFEWPTLMTIATYISNISTILVYPYFAMCCYSPNNLPKEI